MPITVHRRKRRQTDLRTTGVQAGIPWRLDSLVLDGSDRVITITVMSQALSVDATASAGCKLYGSETIGSVDEADATLESFQEVEEGTELVFRATIAMDPSGFPWAFVIPHDWPCIRGHQGQPLGAAEQGFLPGMTPGNLWNMVASVTVN